MTLRALGLALLLAGPMGCAPETRLTEDTFRVQPTLPDACVELSRQRLSFLADVGDSETLNVRVRSACEGVLELRSDRLFIRTNDPELPTAEVVVTGEAPE